MNSVIIVPLRKQIWKIIYFVSMRERNPFNVNFAKKDAPQKVSMVTVVESHSESDGIE